MSNADQTVAVLGAGTMGTGIALLCCSAGWVTRLYDKEPAQVITARQRIAKHLEKHLANDRSGRPCEGADLDRVLQLLEQRDTVEGACRGASWVIEAVVEHVDAKVEVLASARDATRDALLASNTSSLSITEIGSRLQAAERMIGMHFFNPPAVMELVEVVRGLHSSAETVALGRQISISLGKTPIVVNDSPGFATSRLGLAIGAEAMRMVEAGVASVADIDKAMELGYRHPMGPLKLSDLVGLDVRLAILEHLHREVGEQFRPPILLRQMVRAGWLGKKSSRGFYRWTSEGPIPSILWKIGPDPDSELCYSRDRGINALVAS